MTPSGCCGYMQVCSDRCAFYDQVSRRKTASDGDWLPGMTRPRGPVPPEPPGAFSPGMHTHRLPPSIRQLLWLILAIAVAFAAAIWPALAHDPAHPEWNQWLLDQRNQNDAVCCDGQDTLVLSDNEWRMGNGHYEVLYDGAWHEVPDWALTKSQGNITGSALLWVLSGSVRCFKPGTFY